jgi:phenylalanyl-tRNA synthetase beta chain
MNILVPYSWLKDFLKTSASPSKTAEALSLCSQSVEKIHKTKDDSILEIEISVNRYDCLSIIGIAREAATCLPEFGTKASFKPAKVPPLPKIEKQKYILDVQIKDKDICPRFSAIVIDQVKIKPSPKWLSERLEKVDIRALSNVVDISNYLMVETGQPIHTFDFDKILGTKMIMRLSRPGEKITTLDDITRELPGEDIIIEDGKGRLIDLCGIMGAANSQIDENTQRVLFFVQAYNQTRIRKTSFALGHRTEAAARFERGIDLEGILPVLSQGVKLIEDLSGGIVASKLIDIYPQPQKRATVELNYEFLESRVGIKITPDKVSRILKSLGFEVMSSSSKSLKVKAPTWRAQDIVIEEDLIEEIARVYGYYRLPSNLPPLDSQHGFTPLPQPKKGKIEPYFQWENKVKDLLVNQGYSEIYNYSFISQELIKKSGLNEKKHLRLTNPLTNELEYLRFSLVPSLLKTCSQNQAFFPSMKIFELASVYLPQEKKLPIEKPRLVCLITGETFQQLKGIPELILRQMGIDDISFKPWVGREPYFTLGRAAVIETSKKVLGTIGEINSKMLSNFEILSKVIILDLDFEALVKLASTSKTYTSIPKYPAIIEDLTFVLKPKTLVGELIQMIKGISSIIRRVELIDSYKNQRTFRITYQNPKKTLTGKEVEKLREKIIMKLRKKFGTKLKS